MKGIDYIVTTEQKLALSNLKFILLHADLLALRFALAVGSVVWSSWVLFACFVYPGILDDYDLPFGETRLIAWAVLFFVHGATEISAMLTQCQNKAWSMIRTMLGATLWTISLDIVLLVRLAENTLPMGGAHWFAAIVAWWIFMRDIFSKGQYE